MPGTQKLTVTAVAADYPSAALGTYPGIVVIYTLTDGDNGGLAINYTLANGTATGVIGNQAVTLPTNSRPPNSSEGGLDLTGRGNASHSGLSLGRCS